MRARQMADAGDGFRMRARDAADYLGVSLMTLRKIENDGDIVPFRTPGGHRRYSLRILRTYIQKRRRFAAPRDADLSD